MARIAEQLRMAPLLTIVEVLREMLAPAAPDYIAHLPTPTPEDDDDDDEEEDKDRGSGGSIDPDDDEGGYDDDDDEEEPLQTREHSLLSRVMDRVGG
jgi:hypothetical protein